MMIKFFAVIAALAIVTPAAAQESLFTPEDIKSIQAGMPRPTLEQLEALNRPLEPWQQRGGSDIPRHTAAVRPAITSSDIDVPPSMRPQTVTSQRLGREMKNPPIARCRPVITATPLLGVLHRTSDGKWNCVLLERQ